MHTPRLSYLALWVGICSSSLAHAAPGSLWNSPCAPPGMVAPHLSVHPDSPGGLELRLMHGPSSGKAFILVRDHPLIPDPPLRIHLAGCASISSGTLLTTLDIDANGEASLPLGPLLAGTRPTLSAVCLPMGGTLFDSLMSNSVPLGQHSGDVSYQSGEVIVTEIMKDPSSVSDTAGEWIELHNPGTSAVDVEGWILADDGSDGHILFADWAGMSIPAGGYFVLGRNGDSALNGGVTVDYVYEGFVLGNGDDEVVLRRPEAVQVDRVVYSDPDGWPDVAGSSMSLDPSVVDPFLADDSSHWCPAQTPLGPGSTDEGTPGSLNDICP